MNTNPQKSDKSKIFLYFLLVIVLTGISIFFFIEKHTLSQNLAKTQEELMLYNEKLEFLTQKSYADELFIAGAHDSAIIEYKKLFSDADEVGFFAKRSDLKKQIEDEQREAIRKDKAMMELGQMESSLKLNLSLTEERLKAINDSITKSLKSQISELSETLAQKEAALRNMPVMQNLNFTNSKGSKIKYFGEVINGKAAGQGIGIWNTGSVYEGEWKNNLRHGKGKYEWPDGEKYEGEYINGQRSGLGNYFWKNGDKYEGYWKEDKRNGYGTVYDAEGNVKFKGEWKNDVLTPEANKN
jgi:hypothetical protein